MEVFREFNYLDSTISRNLSLDAELNKCICKAVRQGHRVLDNSVLTTNSGIAVDRALVLTTLLYGSKTLTSKTLQKNVDLTGFICAALGVYKSSADMVMSPTRTF